MQNVIGYSLKEKSIKAKARSLIEYLKRYNTFWISYKGEKYLCLELIPDERITFKLGRFNDLGIWINSSDGRDYLDFDIIINIDGSASIRREDGEEIVIEGIADPYHIMNDEWFDGDYNFFKPEYTDEQRSYQKGDLFYCVVDLYKIGRLKDDDNNYLKDLFGLYENRKMTLTICYICNLITHKVLSMVIYDMKNKKPVGKLQYA